MFRKGKIIEEYLGNEKGKSFRKSRKEYMLKKENNPSFREEVKRKQSINCSSRRNEVKIKRKQTFSLWTKENYKNRYEKTKETNLKRYGNESPMRTKEIKEKSKNSCILKYGVEYSSQSDTVKNKKRKTFYKVYGKFFPNTSSYKWKNFILPSGKIVKIQGHEDETLKKLLKCFKEDEIIIHKGVPSIQYFDEFGEKRIHRPDFYIPRCNWIFESKCNYTWNPNQGEKRNNILKMKCAKNLGYKYNVIIS